MIGCELRQHTSLHGRTTAQLIKRVGASRALSEAGTRQHEADELLQKLAVKAASRAESVDAWSEVDRRLAAQDLLKDSRLVIEDARKLDDTPIFREWFAARALVEGAISWTRYSPPRLDG